MSTEVVVRIKSDSAMLVGKNARAEVVRLLREAANRIGNGDVFFILHDINGNRAGSGDADIDETEEE